MNNSHFQVVATGIGSFEEPRYFEIDHQRKHKLRSLV